VVQGVLLGLLTAADLGPSCQLRTMIGSPRTPLGLLVVINLEPFKELSLRWIRRFLVGSFRGPSKGDQGCEHHVRNGSSMCGSRTPSSLPIRHSSTTLVKVSSLVKGRRCCRLSPAKFNDLDPEEFSAPRPTRQGYFRGSGYGAIILHENSVGSCDVIKRMLEP
jgi:hypothetical protein